MCQWAFDFLLPLLPRPAAGEDYENVQKVWLENCFMIPILRRI